MALLATLAQKIALILVLLELPHPILVQSVLIMNAEMLAKDVLMNVLAGHLPLTLVLIIQIMNVEIHAKDVLILALRDIQSHLQPNIMTRLLPNAGLLVINRRQGANIAFVIMTEVAIIQNIHPENLGGGNLIAIIIAKLLEFLNF